MQWTPFDVKVMEHAQRIEQATRLGWITDPQSVPRSAMTNQQVQRVAITVTKHLTARLGVLFPANAH